MAYDFNADDIFEMAEQIERNGATFYRNAAENVSDEKAKELLLGLAAMEDEHEKTFAFMRSELSDKEKETTFFDPEDEAVLYLQALADTRVFFKKDIDISTVQSILIGAIQAEKDSIIFYLGMKDMVPDELGKERVKKIIKEEMVHVRILSSELLSIGKTD